MMRENEPLPFTAIVLAAGRGSRMHMPVEKQFLTLAGKPLFCHALEAFEESEAEEIVLVTGEKDVPLCREIVRKYGFRKVNLITAGGAERYDSVWAGIQAWKNAHEADYVRNHIILIHDGARPLIDKETIRAVVCDARKYGAAIAACPSRDTVKVADREGFTESTPDRRMLWNAQTPQGFYAPLLVRGYEAMMNTPGGREGITDDAMAVERFAGAKVKLTPSPSYNMKVTEKEDLFVAEALISRRSAR